MKLAIFALAIALAFSQAGWAQATLPSEPADPSEAVWVLEDPDQPGVVPGSPSFGWGQYGVGFDDTEIDTARLTTVEPAGGPK
jgi:hypothetical protein